MLMRIPIIKFISLSRLGYKSMLVGIMCSKWGMLVASLLTLLINALSDVGASGRSRRFLNYSAVVGLSLCTVLPGTVLNCLQTVSRQLAGSRVRLFHWLQL